MGKLEVWTEIRVILFYNREDGKPMGDNAVVLAPIQDNDWKIVDWLVEVEDATGRTSEWGKHFGGSKNRLLSSFYDYQIK